MKPTEAQLRAARIAAYMKWCVPYEAPRATLRADMVGTRARRPLVLI